MRFTFENRYHQVHEIKHQFAIKDKTWKVWLYGDTVKIKTLGSGIDKQKSKTKRNNRRVQKKRNRKS